MAIPGIGQPAREARETRTVIDALFDAHERPVGAPYAILQGEGLDRRDDERIDVAIRRAAFRDAKRPGQLDHGVAGPAEFQQRRKAGLIDSAPQVGTSEVVDDEAHSGLAQERRRGGQLVLLAMDLQEPVDLPDAGEQAIRARLGQFGEAVRAEVHPNADHAAIGKRREVAIGDRGRHQRDALQASPARSDRVEHAAIVAAVRLCADQEAVRQAVGVEHGQKAGDAPALARVGNVDRLRGEWIRGIAKDVRVAICGARCRRRRLHLVYFRSFASTLASPTVSFTPSSSSHQTSSA